MNRHSNKLFFYTLFLLTLCLTTPVHAERMQLEIIPLKHRLLSDVLPIVQPLLVEGGTATGMNDQLIVKTTAANIEEIKQILNSLDTPPRRLMITVSQNVDGNLRRNEHGLSGRYRSGDVSIESPDPGRVGLVLQAEDEDGNALRYRTLKSRSKIDDKNTFRVQTIEGQPAFIQTGHSVPIANQQAYVTPGGGVVIQDGVEYRDVTSGFYVIPRLSGNHVTLLIAPQLHKINPHQGGTFDIQNVETTASGTLGEWIQIGGITQQHKEKNTRNLVSTRRQGQEIRNIAVMVEEIP